MSKQGCIREACPIYTNGCELIAEILRAEDKQEAVNAKEEERIASSDGWVRRGGQVELARTDKLIDLATMALQDLEGPCPATVHLDRTNLMVQGDAGHMRLNKLLSESDYVNYPINPEPESNLASRFQG